MNPGGKALAEFVAEATEILDTLGKDLLTLDEQRGQEPDPELINGIFRAAHSLKGLAGLFSQDRIARLAHGTEDLLDRLRLGKMALDGIILDALIESLDVFHALLTEVSRGDISSALAARSEALAERFTRLGTPAAAGEGDPLDWLELDPQIRAVFTEYEEHRLRENVRRGVTLWRVRADFDLSDFDKGLSELNQRLKPKGEIISTLPSAQPSSASGIAFDLIFGAKVPEAELASALEGTPAQLFRLTVHVPAPAAPPLAVVPAPPASAGPPSTSASRRPGSRKGPPPPVGEPPVPAVPVSPVPVRSAVNGNEAPSQTPRMDADMSLRSLTQTVRVDIRRLDGLMNTVGELLLIKANLQRIAEGARQDGAHTPSKVWGQELAREARQLERKLDSLQNGLLEARMVPVGQVFDKLARLVRRIAREAGKELDFVSSGGEVELDKLIVEELSDPLMHIIHNAIDHGVEKPESRVAAGKPRRASVSLRAEQKGNHVIIQVSDDGAGIDEYRVREVALQRGLITDAQAAEMSRREMLNLIFLPGFSTARSVSELSGRGVGLDVVKNNLGNLSGLIDVWSERGRGSAFQLTLPLTLAIIRALVVGVSGRTYAVPINSVLEILSVQPQDIRTVERREVLDLRGQTLPFVRLARMFSLPERPVSRHFVVVVGLAQQRLGIAVDELSGQQDIVTKPLGGRLQSIRGISGATDLGNRRTVLVLDVAALLEEGMNPERRWA
ncbi:CheA signal transduction histidine kinase [Stigmatella aurantiaca]|uniref:histidine kinase n=1 Tax=Stigmatella aurantiaca TaxID=41 RepID=A0A1H8EPE7_STIAU|nr:chemotaxis protein CheA [Stigmatella aurantiaca]SEN21260.1 CheA signal transduction histidine kinase [Stigmatella aurantiaca]